MMMMMSFYQVSFEARDVNPFLICSICTGYFREPHTIIECLHTCKLSFALRNALRLFDVLRIRIILIIVIIFDYLISSPPGVKWMDILTRRFVMCCSL